MFLTIAEGTINYICRQNRNTLKLEKHVVGHKLPLRTNLLQLLHCSGIGTICFSGHCLFCNSYTCRPWGFIGFEIHCPYKASSSKLLILGLPHLHNDVTRYSRQSFVVAGANHHFSVVKGIFWCRGHLHNQKWILFGSFHDSENLEFSSFNFFSTS